MTSRPPFLPERITLEDVAERLAKINRFAGGTHAFFSVAQHCVIVAEALTADPKAALYGLLHDAHEAWMSDIPTRVKQTLSSLAGADVVRALEDDCDRVIFPAFGLAWPVPREIAPRLRDFDHRAFLTEKRDVALPLVENFAEFATPFSKVITTCWPWPKAEANFIETFDRFATLANLPARKKRAAC